MAAAILAILATLAAAVAAIMPPAEKDGVIAAVEAAGADATVAAGAATLLLRRL